jgi:hypothetical protein
MDMNPPEAVKKLAEDLGGKITSVGDHGDGTGFATMSFPLPKDHWLYKYENGDVAGSGVRCDVPPMPFRMGKRARINIAIHNEQSGPLVLNLSLSEFEALISKAGRYAIRASTEHGKDNDWDPDAVLQNLRVAFTGYCTDNGLSSESWADPQCPKCNTPLVVTDAEGLWCEKGCYESEYALWDALHGRRQVASPGEPQEPDTAAKQT